MMMRIMEAKQQIRRWVNSQTAGFCQDHERPKEFEDPPSRVIGRLTFTIFIAFSALLTTSLLFFKQQPNFRTVRYWGRSYALHRFSPYTSSTISSGDPIYTSLALSTICPCSVTAGSWTSYTRFFTISMPQGQKDPVRTAFITDGHSFCYNQILNLPIKSSNITLKGCPRMIDSVVNFTDQRTILESTTLMDPVLLNTTIRRHLQSNLDQELNSCVSLWTMGTWDILGPFLRLRNIRDLWTAMLDQVKANPQSTDREMWEAASKFISEAGEVPVAQILGNETAIGMEVDWDEYVESCNPVYCDVVEQCSWEYRLFGLLAQVGGFGALTLLVARKVLWPAMRWTCGWPSEDSPVNPK